jgi:ATP-dependent exoDNAse (exonuclease V) alpha subunit
LCRQAKKRQNFTRTLWIHEKNGHARWVRAENTDWNEKNEFLNWRKGWTEVNNRVFERKGREYLIDHRSYQEQGIDREPMIHLGYEAAALLKLYTPYRNYCYSVSLWLCN